MAVVGIQGQTGGKGGLVSGADVIVSHSAGASGMTDHGVVTMADGNFRLLEVKQSGTLTFDDSQLGTGIPADICIVGGGSGGDGWNTSSGGDFRYGGGPGGYLYNFYDVIIKSDLLAAIGAGGTKGTGGSGYNTYFGTGAGRGGQTSLTKVDAPDTIPFNVNSATNPYNTNTYTNGCGTAGGGSNGVPDGKPKYPFEDSGYFNIHCGGGGQGGYIHNFNTYAYTNGAPGGTNGGAAGSTSNQGSSPVSGGAAGDSSAGAGGGVTSSSQTAGSNAAYYGGGGGGGGMRQNSSNWYIAAGGNGYQGVVWIRIPA